jgi:hypothetical protein
MRREEQSELNHALLDIAKGAKSPWDTLRPGVRVQPLATEADELSQAPTPAQQSRAPTREGTPAPEQRQRTPTPGPRPVMVPEAVPEEEEEPAPPEPRRKRRRRSAPARKAQAAPVPDRRSVQTPDALEQRPAAEPRARIAVPAQALALVRRARAWRARHGASPARITPAAYDAVDTRARFGLIERRDLAQPWPGQTVLVAHTPPRRDPAALLEVRPGDTIDVLSTRSGAEGWAPLRVQFVTRSHYFAPGRPATSLVLGVRTDEWAHALRGTPPSE